MRPLFVSASVLVLLAHAGAARADAERVALDWSGPAECPAASDVRERVAQRIPEDAAVRAQAHVERAGARYRVVLAVEARGERTLEADTCDALASSVAVVVAMSVAPPPQERTPPADPAEPKREPSAAPAQPEEPERPTAPAPPAAGPRFAVGIEAAAATGTLPDAAFGGGVAASFAPVDALRLELVGRIWGADDGHVDASRGATFHLLTGSARACWVLGQRATIAACLGAEIAHLSASGFGAAKPEDATATTWAPEALALGRVPIGGPIALRAGFGAVVPTSRPSFVITAAGSVHRPAAVALRGFVGPEVLF